MSHNQLSQYVSFRAVSAACGSHDPRYINQLRESVPDNGFPVAIRTEGPLGKPVLRIAVHDNMVAVVTEGSTDQDVIWTTTDLQTWHFRAYTTGVPSALLPLDRLYWFATGRFQYQDGPNQPQDITFPYQVRMSDLIPNEDGLLAVAGTSSIYGRSSEGLWSEIATVSIGARLSSLTKTSKGFCAVSSDTDDVWFWNDLKASPLALKLPVGTSGVRQITATNDHVYVLTQKSLLEGDVGCANWRDIVVPADSGNAFSVAAGQQDLFLGTESGIYILHGGSWERSTTSITRAAVRRLRALHGILYACHSGGLSESHDLGQSWHPSATPLGIGIPVADVIEYGEQYFAATEHGLYTRRKVTDPWSIMNLPADAPVALKTIAAADNYLVLAGVGATDKKYNVTILELGTSRAIPGMNGLEAVHGMRSLATIQGNVFALTDIGLFRLDTSRAMWVPDSFNNQLGGVTAVAAFKKRGIIVATASHDLWYTEAPEASNHAWRRLADTSFMRDMPQPINDIWSDASGKDVFVSYFSQLLCIRDGKLLFGNHPDYSDGFSFALLTSGGNDHLFVGSDFGVAYIDRRLPNSFSLARFQALYQQYSGEFWFWPISLVILFLGSYLISVFCVLVLLYLPIPRGLIGTGWLITQIAKSLTISPWLGRWILFIGYNDRLRKRFASLVSTDTPGRYLLIDNSSGTAKETSDQISVAAQIEMLLAEKTFVLVEHSIMPTLPQSIALACCSDDDSQGGNFAGVIPVLIAPSDWKDNVATSASNVLRNHFSVPVDTSEMLVGQMERGDIRIHHPQPR